MIIDAEKLKDKFRQIWNAEGRFSHESMCFPLDDLLKAFDQPEFNIKSPKEVERVIRYFEDDRKEKVIHFNRAIADLIRYLHPELGQKQFTWKGEDFKEKTINPKEEK